LYGALPGASAGVFCGSISTIIYLAPDHCYPLAAVLNGRRNRRTATN
jgi:hypothetical protein